MYHSLCALSLVPLFDRLWRRYCNFVTIKFNADNVIIIMLVHKIKQTRIVKSVLKLPRGRGTPSPSPTAIVDPYVIHGIEVSALSASRCRPSTVFS